MSLLSLNLIGQTIFDLESGNENVDGETDGQKNGQKTDKGTNRITPILKRNLAMMVIYVPVKYEFDWTNCFQVRVQKQKSGQSDGQTSG